jgi:hypothetical protein
LHEVEVELLLTLAAFAEAHDEPTPRQALHNGSGLEHAEFVRRVRYLIEIGLIREDRDRPLAEPGQVLSLTGEGTLWVVAERAVARRLQRPGPRSRLSPLAADD